MGKQGLYSSSEHWVLFSVANVGSGDSSVVERRTRDRKVSSSSPGRSCGRIFFSSVFCADSYFCIRSTPALPQQHVKDPVHSAKSAGGRLQRNTYAPYVSSIVNWCMAVCCTQNLRRDGSSFTWHQPRQKQLNSIVTTSVGI